MQPKEQKMATRLRVAESSVALEIKKKSRSGVTRGYAVALRCHARCGRESDLTSTVGEQFCEPLPITSTDQ